MDQLHYLLIYIICGLIAAFKQKQVTGVDGFGAETPIIAAFIFGPFWLGIGIIRQAFIETWR